MDNQQNIDAKSVAFGTVDASGPLLKIDEYPINLG
jgi:hypothetical protein